ncbi:MAG TPA: T9SS type A sorting domain-containing protein [Flavobacteriaceae bacterium]|nr:T9SS type A sorting domain-containing protein [Flavobacteriaceae bacterium]MCB9213122.1 T9SS type A sorting domain-containing protein [Alteromonas sp.]HPF11028.1 T9SS type A sorting domain-containing protein [Flavobacteriaceae bacterium]HQU21873.1 T9SS type A sorting domain-containing protein [Flavobacteriaceae bacterium]HQU64123.1 T9SS type A sorting domain-containing protein [Flavobacteriaceae bacterium]
MKQNLFLAFAFASMSWMASAQFTLETQEGDPIVDGQTVTYGTLDETSASLHFYVNNESTTDEIYMKVEFVSAVNYDGTNMQVCFGLCYDPVIVGVSYPPGTDVVIIQPGQHQDSVGDKFWNYNDGGGSPVEYVFRFYQVDGAGMEIGDDLSFTYRYDPDLGVNEATAVKANLASTIVKDQLVVQAQEDVQIQMFNIQGKLLVNQKLNAGTNNVNIASLPAQVYLVQIANEKGASQTVKVVKR